MIWRFARKTLLPALVACLLIGCGGGDAETASHEAFRIQLGTGDGEAFAPLPSDAPLLLQRGCQGSQHVSVSLRARDLDSDRPRVEMALVRAGDGRQLSLPLDVRVPFLPAGAWMERNYLLLVVPEPSLAIGEAVELRAAVHSDDGASASATHQGVVQWGPDAC